MNRFSRKFLVAVIALLALTSCLYAQEFKADVTVQTPKGVMKGFERDGILHWFGVPYAKAPTGALRWKAPQPVEAWDGVFEATESLAGSQTASLHRVLVELIRAVRIKKLQ